MRRAPSRSTLPLAALLLGLGLVGCSGDDGGGDAGVPPTGDGGPTTGADAGPADSGVEARPFGLHYHRVDGAYDGWTLTISGDGITEGTVTASETTGFGAFFPLPAGAGAVTFSLANAATSDPAGERSVDASGAEGLWVFEDHAEVYTEAFPAVPGDDQVVVYYLRGDDDYGGWGLHLWEDVEMETLWAFPAPQEGIDARFGAYWTVDMAAGGDRCNLIVHKGDEKDPGPDMGFNISELGNIVFVVTGDSTIYPAPQGIPGFSIQGASAAWVDETTIAWDFEDQPATQFELRYSDTAEIDAVEGEVTGGTVVALTEATGGFSEAVRAKFPHLRNRTALTIGEADRAAIPDILRGQIVVVARDDAGAALSATKVQIPGVLDALYTYSGPLGVEFDGNRAPTIRLWAPTAQTVRLVRSDADLAEVETHDMTRGEDGVWSVTGDASWYGQHYQYELTVYHPITDAIETTRTTDPWALSLSRNSTHVHIVDVANDTALMPQGWDMTPKAPLAAPEDIVIYESHIRDFSILDTSVPVEHRGKYLAFTHSGAGGTNQSRGMAHLERLVQAGLTHVHVLPAFDIATVNEDPAQTVDLTSGFDALCALNDAVPDAACAEYGSTPIGDVLAGFDPTSEDAQALMGWMRSFDGFNWGYDPWHYTVPEGSYATDPAGGARILEFRRMVQGLADIGARFVMDVVYNHTNSAGLADQSVLDKVVPGYYHRLNAASGFVESSTCCQNTATEHTMMERLMIDSLVSLARLYKVDGFRFDLMGHHMKVNMERARDALAALTLEADGVDGSTIYLYGEGWDFGEVQGGQRGRNASQTNMGGTGIGTFNDRLRDAVRGGGPFDSGFDIRVQQGWGNGLVYEPNEQGLSGEEARNTLGNLQDLIRVGMAGNLAGFRLTDQTGASNTGSFIGYNGARAGYTQDPQEIINYVSKHDNQTLWDNSAYKMATGVSSADRTRMHNVSMDVVALGQGVPFFHMGSDILRSKSMQRDSFDSGDWYNRVDWTYQTNNWNVGLPRADKDEMNFPVILTVLEDATLQPAPADIEFGHAHFQEILQIRKSTPLFRLRTAEQVQTRLDFHNVGPDQVPGLIVMSISDGTCAGADLDPAHDGVVAILNANDEAQTFTVSGLDGFALHPVQQASVDPVVRGASFDDGADTFSVPARTTAVFVQAQAGAQGAGVPCNAR